MHWTEDFRWHNLHFLCFFFDSVSLYFGSLDKCILKNVTPNRCYWQIYIWIYLTHRYKLKIVLFLESFLENTFSSWWKQWSGRYLLFQSQQWKPFESNSHIAVSVIDFEQMNVGWGFDVLLLRALPGVKI